MNQSEANKYVWSQSSEKNIDHTDPLQWWPVRIHVDILLLFVLSLDTLSFEKQSQYGYFAIWGSFNITIPDGGALKKNPGEQTNKQINRQTNKNNASKTKTAQPRCFRLILKIAHHSHFFFLCSREDNYLDRLLDWFISRTSCTGDPRP